MLVEGANEAQDRPFAKLKKCLRKGSRINGRVEGVPGIVGVGGAVRAARFD